MSKEIVEVKFSQVFMLVMFSQFFSVSIYIIFAPLVQNWPDVPSVGLVEQVFSAVFVGLISLIIASPATVLGSFVSKYMIEQRIVDPILWVVAAVVTGYVGSIHIGSFSGLNFICAPMIGLFMCLFARRILAEKNKEIV